jgi:aspartate aminotransferase
MPKGAFYMFPDVSYYFGKSDGNKVIKDADDLAMYLLNNYYIAVVSGNAFGNPNCIRLSYATSEDLLIEACKRLKEGLINLK